MDEDGVRPPPPLIDARAFGSRLAACLFFEGAPPPTLPDDEADDVDDALRR